MSRAPQDVGPIDLARHAAFSALAAQAPRFPDLIPLGPDTAQLGARDAAFAHAIYDAAVRRWLTLVHLLTPYVKHPFPRLEPGIVAALLGGAAQMILLDRVPRHAALSTAVEWTKREVGRGPSGLVNAVLRKLSATFVDRRPQLAWGGQRDAIPLSDGGCALFSRAVLPEAASEATALATSHPLALISAWTRDLGEDEARAAAMHGLVSPPTIVNAIYAGATLPPPNDGSLNPHVCPGHHVLLAPRDRIGPYLDTQRHAWVQDPASSKAIAGLHAKIGRDVRLILDLCAGQGTKSRQLVHEFPDARVIATDVDAGRFAALARLAERVERLEAVKPEGIRNRLAMAGGGADLVLLDVPCSNTGVLARRVEARYRADASQLDRLVKIQRSILTDAVGMLRSKAIGREGPWVLYSTCSLERAENEHQVAWACESLGLRALSQSLTLPAGLPGDSADRYHDGSFSALLEPVKP